MDEQNANNEKTGKFPPESSPAAGERQELNAMLAQLARGGNKAALAQLWELNRPALRSMFWRWYSQNKGIADAAGVTVEDFEQEGYFAVQAAVQTYDPGKGSFLTMLQYRVKNQIRTATTGGHMRIATTEDGKRVQVAADPLHTAASLDEPLTGTSGDEMGTRGDVIPDPAATQAFEDAERAIYRQELRGPLEKAVGALQGQQRAAITALFYEGKTLKQAGEVLGVTPERVRQAKLQALRQLRNKTELQRFYYEDILARAYRGTGLNAWRYGGSVEERLVERMEERDAAASTRHLAALLGYAPRELAGLLHPGESGTKCDTSARTL